MKKITVDNYADAVSKLVPVAKSDTGQSYRCAQVLLSAYNGGEFFLSIPELSGLDADLYDAAIMVIRGRSELRIEPHILIQNGKQIFYNLYDRWPNLRLENIGKVNCPVCRGRGVIYDDHDDEVEATPCNYCKKTGRVCRCKG